MSHTAEEIKQATEKIAELQEKAREAYAEALVVSDEFGVPFTVPHNEYHPEKYSKLQQEYEELEDSDDRRAWIDAHGFDPDDYIGTEYGGEGWQSSYC